MTNCQPKSFTDYDAICNDGRDQGAFVEEIGDDMVTYCKVSDDRNGYPEYAAPTPSGTSEMYYETDLSEINVTSPGYVIYHEGGIKAYCIDTDPTNCGYQWITMDWSGQFYQDTDMDTFECDCG